MIYSYWKTYFYIKVLVIPLRREVGGVLVIARLHESFKLRKIIVSTYQALGEA